MLLRLIYCRFIIIITCLIIVVVIIWRWTYDSVHSYSCFRRSVPNCLWNRLSRAPCSGRLLFAG